MRPASTVILARAGEPLEVFMLRRSARSAFAPNVYVFPGGTVDERDRATSDGVDRELLRRMFRMETPPPPALQASLVAAARRELHEEAGVLLDASWPLELFSHWITPLSIAPRYDVYFFVTRIPEGQEAVADANETHDGIWIAPRDALARDEASGFSIIYPTRKHLERLARFRNADEMLAAARSKPIRTVLAHGSEREGFALPAGLEDAW